MPAIVSMRAGRGSNPVRAIILSHQSPAHDITHVVHLVHVANTRGDTAWYSLLVAVLYM
jgi:hypothetical protein